MDTKLTKWLKWMKVIHDDIQQLVMAKHEFSEIRELINNNSKLHKPNSFYSYLSKTYATYVSVGLRRQIKINSQSISFARLLKEMVESPSTFSRKYYVGLYKGSVVEQFANKDFEKFADISAPHINSDLVSDDLAKIITISKLCINYTDQRIAHWDKKEPKEIPLFKDLDKCIDLLDELYVKYHLLFYAASMDSLLPTRQYDWQAIFREPWIPPLP